MGRATAAVDRWVFATFAPERSLPAMNWLDWVLLILVAIAAVRGFMRGFILELCGLIGLVLGIWGAIHLNDRVAAWLGLDVANEVLSFLVTLGLIVALVHLLGLLLTKVLEAAQLELPNRLGGLLFGAVRKAFLLSVVLNVLLAWRAAPWGPSAGILEESILFRPLRAFAPAVLPDLAGSKWLAGALEELNGLEQRIDEQRAD
jgi:membrane protein required for colicin V production